MGTQLSEKEKNLFVLILVKSCLQYGKDAQKSFESVLNEDVFANKGNTDFAEMVCKTIKSLNTNGYINGTVEIEYEKEYELDKNGEEFEEEITDNVDFSMCNFIDISISLKGKAFLGVEGFKTVSKDFYEKVKPFLSYIAKVALKEIVEKFIEAGLKLAGIPV